jgi:hypothetical protein
MMARDCTSNVGCGQEFILIGIRASERLPEQFGQIVIIELNLDRDGVVVCLSLKADEWAVVAIESAYFPKALGKIGASNAHMNDPRSGPA